MENKQTLTQVYSGKVSKGIDFYDNAFDKNFLEYISGPANRGVEDTCESILSGLDDILDPIKKAGEELLQIVKDNSTDALGDGLTKMNSAVTYVCGTVNNVLKEVISLIEITISIVVVVIDKLIKIIEQAIRWLNQLARLIANCFNSLITKVVNILNALTNSSIDFTEIALAIDDCPQLFCMLKSLVGPLCDSDPVNTRELIECLKDTITISFSNFIIQVIRNAIDETLKSIEKIIRDVKNAILFPVRELAKVYLGLLHKKIDIPKPFRWIFSDLNNCSGKKKASLIEILRALKDITVCIDSICSLGSMRRDIQAYNEKLKLAMSYWLSYNFGYDLFITLEDDDNRDRVANKVRDAEINKNDDSLAVDSITSTINNIQSGDSDPMEQEYAKIYADAKESLINGGYILDNGTTEFKTGIEEELVKIYNNLGKEFFRYESKIDEFFNWDSGYYKTELQKAKKKLIDLMDGSEEPDKVNGMAYIFSSDSKIPPIYTSITQPEIIEEIDVYKPLKNYTTTPIRVNGETDAEYYTNWYKSL